MMTNVVDYYDVILAVNISSIVACIILAAVVDKSSTEIIGALWRVDV